MADSVLHLEVHNILDLEKDNIMSASSMATFISCYFRGLLLVLESPRIITITVVDRII